MARTKFSEIGEAVENSPNLDLAKINFYGHSPKLVLAKFNFSVNRQIEACFLTKSPEKGLKRIDLPGHSPK